MKTTLSASSSVPRLVGILALAILWAGSVRAQPFADQGAEGPTPGVAAAVPPLDTIYALVSPSPLKARRLCGTFVADIVRENWSRLDPTRIPLYYHPAAETEDSPRTGDGLGLQTLETAGGHFLVHYAETGEHAIAGWEGRTPLEKATEFGAALERAYSVFRDDLGLPPPLPDGLRGGDDRIDVYVFRLDKDNINGRVRSEAASVGGACPGSRSGYVELQSDLPEYGVGGSQVQLTAAHEVFHLFQNVHYRNADKWFKESTAEWSELRVRLPDGVPRDLRLLRFWFDTPNLTLWSLASRPLRIYASFHYWEFLEQLDRLTGPAETSLVADIWRNCCSADGENRSWHSVLPEVLRERNPSFTFDNTLVEFSIWNHNPRLYLNGSNIPSVKEIRSHPRAQDQDYPTVTETISSSNPEVAQRAGSNYVTFGHSPDGNPSRALQIEFDGAPGVLRVVVVVKRVLERRSDGSDDFVLVGEPVRKYPDADGDVRFVVDGWDDIDQVMMIITNFKSAAGDLGYRYSSREIDHLPPTTLASPRPFPNPSRGPMSISFTVDGPAAPVSIVVFGLSGRLVRTLASDALFAPGTHVAPWDGRDESGRVVAAGVYFARLRTGNSIAVERIVRVP